MTKHDIGRFTLVIFILASCPGLSAAKIISIPDDERTITDGIQNASDLDTVLVAPGRYSENLVVFQKAITIIGANGADETFLDGSSIPDSAVIAFNGGQHPSLVKGFTIERATTRAVMVKSTTVQLEDDVFQDNTGICLECFGASVSILSCSFAHNDHWTSWPSFGSAILCQMSSFGPSIVNVDNCEFNDNRSGFGSAMCILDGGSFSLTNSTIRDNWVAFDGGGVFCWPRTTHYAIRKNTFSNNIADDHGGAIVAGHYAGGDCLIEQNLFSHNQAFGKDSHGVNGVGGAMYITGLSGSIRNNTVANNEASVGGGISIHFSEGQPAWEIKNNIIAFNTCGGITCSQLSGTLSIEQNVLYGNGLCQNVSCQEVGQVGNLQTDPLFCNLDERNYYVEEDSPALSIMAGAYLVPGCVGTRTVATTWSRIKLLTTK